MAFLSFLRHRKVMPPNTDPVALGDPTRPIHNVSTNADDISQFKNDFESEQRRLDFKWESYADEYRKEDRTPRPSRGPSRIGTPFLGPGH